MGRNTGNGSRLGLTRNRHQFLNPANGQWVKVDTSTGKFLGTRAEPWKSIRVKKTIKKKGAVKKKVTKKIAIKKKVVKKKAAPKARARKKK